MKTLTCTVCLKEFQSVQPHAVLCSKECRKTRLDRLSGRGKWQDEVATPTIGAVSEMEVSTFLMKKGYAVFRALSAACFCDLIACKEKATYRIEVRTGYSVNGGKTLTFPKHTHGEIDLFGVYVSGLDRIAFYKKGGEEVVL